MIYEQRTYRTHPGKASDFLQLYEEEGLKIITRHAMLAGCWISESGALDTVTFLWAFKDHGHRRTSTPSWPPIPTGHPFCPRSCRLWCIRKLPCCSPPPSRR
ncbi:NIPSNAP family protein [Allgaiera indica]|uniref:NIPSNAP protein n=1 Tax=Allgaiera indica TaxID=765699 RepID=A0A1H2VXG5_9RHOB|nr:NIPSNAP family protein [Allgaiera indica]SDW73013.1 NIPSNAP protein [Allgaiera indica]